MAYLFLDLETTGLDPRRDHILEVGWQFTDDQFRAFAPPESYILDMFTDAWVRLNQNGFVKKMHTDSGLLDDIRSNDHPKTIDEVSNLLVDQITDLPSGQYVHLAGFSVHFDKAFLGQYRSFDIFFGDDHKSLLHHRMLDLSSVKMMLDTTGIPYTKADNPRPHRALHDVVESVHQAQIFREMLTNMYDDHMLIEAEVLALEKEN